MDKELERIIKQMVEAGEPEEAIALRIKLYKQNKGTTATPSQDNVKEPVEETPIVKKKEATGLPSPAWEATSASVGSDTNVVPKPQNVIQAPKTISEIPDQEVDEPISQLYDSYIQAGKVQPTQQKVIETKINSQKKGDRGFWETASAVTKGFLQTGVAVPMFQYDTKEDLTAKRELKNKTDFLSELPEETLVELTTYAGNKIGELENSNLNLLAENKFVQEKSKNLVNSLKYQARGFDSLKEQGKEVPQKLIEEYNKMYDEVVGMSATYNSNIDMIENTTEDIGDFYEEINLLKKNYGGLDYYKDMTRLTFASLGSGIAEFALDTDRVLEEYTSINPVTFGSSDPQAYRKKAKESIAAFRKETGNQQGDLRPSKSVSDINSMSDFGGWLAEQVATQLPVLTILAATGGTAGLGALGASAAGQKIGELEDKRGEAYETIGRLNALLVSGQEFTEDELKEIDMTIAEAEKTTAISDDEMYVAGLGTFALEVLTEKVTLGVLSKGKRAYTAAKSAGGASFKEFGKGVGNSFLSGVSEGQAEFVNQVGGNLIDIMYLNDPDVHIFDGAMDALASGNAMGFSMRFSPMVLGMGHKAFASKELTAKIKVDSQKITNLTEELEVNENLDSETKEVINSKIETLKEGIAKSMKKTFDDVSKMSKEDSSELKELDKKANKISARVKTLQESDVNKELKAELIIDLKADIDALAARKQEILNKPPAPTELEVAEKELKDIEAKNEGRLTELGVEIDAAYKEETIDTAKLAKLQDERSELFKSMDAQTDKVYKLREAELKDGTKQEVSGESGEPKKPKGRTRKGTKEVQGKTKEDTSDVGDAEPNKVKLKRQSAGVYTDTVNDYTVNKTENGKWEVRTESDSKGKKDYTVLGSFANLKEATNYLQGQTSKRAEILQQTQMEANAGNMFDVKEDKSKFNWRKLLSGTPVVSYIDEKVFSKMAKAIEDKISFYGNKAFLGQYNIGKDGTVPTNRWQKQGIDLKNFGIETVNAIVLGAANVSNSFYKGSLRTDAEMTSSRRVEGYQKRTLSDAKVLTKALGDLIDNNQESAKRVHQALDPDIYDETVKYEDLNEGEKTLFDTLRSINQATHELNFKNGFISKETFDKYDGKYIGRGYKVYEDGLSETEREVMVNTSFFGGIYKQRQEINQWIMDNTVEDPIYLTMNRMVRSQRNVVVKEYADFISNKYGVKVKPEKGIYTQLNGKSYGKLNGQWIPSNVAEDFKGYFFNNSFLDAAYQGLNIYNQSLYKQFMKRFHTVYSPFVQAGNFVANIAFAHAAGVNVIQLGLNMRAAGLDLYHKRGDFEAVMVDGLIGSNIMERDLQLTSEKGKNFSINMKDDNLSLDPKGIIKGLDKGARRLYSGSDNVMKLAAYKALKQVGYNHEESIQRVYEGFQNYASVGKIWDIFSKVPVWGSDYIKFQGDLNRIVKNSVTKRPLTTASLLYGFNLIAMAASRLSEEEEGERNIRESRTSIPKIRTFLGDVPLIYRVGDNEVNLARYVSPFYTYDTGSQHWSEELSKYSPVNIKYNEEDESWRVLPSDVALGSVWAAFADNRDFRDMIISDPSYNIYTGFTASDSQKLTNRVLYVLRSQVPLFSFGNDLAMSASFGEDYYGRDTSPLKVLLSRIVKIQTWDETTTAKQVVKSLKTLEIEERGLKTKRSSISNFYDKEVYSIEDRFNNGEINKTKFENLLNRAEKDFESRNASLAEKEALLQEKFNRLDEDVKSLGVSFKSILDKASN